MNPDDVEQLLTYADKDNVIIMSKLYDSVTKKTLYVGNVHSTFSDYKFIDITTLQVNNMITLPLSPLMLDLDVRYYQNIPYPSN